jgi:rhomboid protease GluP
MFRSLRQAPVTFASLVVMAMVFAGTHGLAGDDAQALSELRRAWGNIEPLNWARTVGDRVDVEHPDLHGPFDLWNGDWWRLPMTTLHHVAFWHLGLNMLATAMLGRVLEQAWGSGRYLLFVLGAAAVSMFPEYLLDEYAIGYSGVVCAIFGALIVVRRNNADAAAWISDAYVVTSFATLIGMWVLTELGEINVGNLAHFAGLAYGWGIARVMKMRWPVRWGVVAAHALLVIPYWYATHPVWNGRYHWYRAGVTATGEVSEREDPAELAMAVRCDPALAGAWRLLAEEAERRDQPLEAWRLTLHGLRASATNAELWADARRQWRRFAVGPDRETARTYVRELFGDESRVLDELRRLRPPPVLIAPDRPIGPTAEMLHAAIEPKAWQPTSPDTWRALTDFAPRLTDFDPTDPHSAVEGERW